MKITAACLALIFSGSYISSQVQNALDDYKKSEEERSASDKNKPEAEMDPVSVTTVTAPLVTELSDVSATVPVTTVPITTVTTSVTTTPLLTTTSSRVTTVKMTAASAVTKTEKITSAAEPPAPVTEPPAPETDPPAPTEAPSVPQQPSGSLINPVPESPRADLSYLKNCVFIGDSHILRLTSTKYMGDDAIQKSNVLAYEGLGVPNLAEKIPASSVRSLDPEIIYIMMGTNSVNNPVEGNVKGYLDYIKSLKELMPAAKIYIMSIPPVGKNVEERSYIPILNSTVDAYNDGILKMANENGCYYLNIHPLLESDEGYLVNTKDGLHVNAENYDIIIDYILTHIAK